MALTDLLRQYSLDPENYINNYDLAREYDRLGQTSAAISFYLRCAERTKQNIIAYECLIRSAICLRSQGDRNFSYTQQLKHAITVMPDRPEAYFFLCQYLESEQKYHGAYLYACIALGVCDFSNPIFVNEYNYVGKDGLEVSKAVCGIHWDKIEESRQIFTRLMNQSSNDYIKTLCRSNLQAISSQP